MQHAMFMQSGLLILIAHEAVLFHISLHGSRKLNYPILDGVIQLQLTCMKVACLMCEIVDTGNQQSNKEIDWKKVFYVF